MPCYSCLVLFLIILHYVIIQSECIPSNNFQFYEDHKIPDRKDLKSSNQFDESRVRGNVARNNEQNNKEFWINGGLDALKNRLNIKERRGVAKNVILFLGDGMSVPTLAAARIYQGQKAGETGEEAYLSFEKFPFTGLSKTYCVDSQVADSACSATAYLCGVKANIETIGVTGAVKKYDCEAMNNEMHKTNSIASWAQAAGKATGFVTTTRVSHASPSGLYAHIAQRDWEYDGRIKERGLDSEKCFDITRQLVSNDPGKKFKVILGGGRGTFLPNTEKDPEYNNITGWRSDNKNLIKEWLESKERLNLSARFVWNRSDLISEMNHDSADYLLGLFEPSHMQFHMDADEDTEPTLEEMTKIAIKKLSKEEKGFFLFVEGGKIDLAHHYNLAEIALDETLEFSKAIKAAREMTSEEDTLIIVTADHAHTMSFSGYAKRGSDILNTLQMGDMDDLPYSTLSYANGPGYKQSLDTPEKRYNLTNDQLVMNTSHYKFPALLPLTIETHGGDDVAVFASGPWSHLLVGNFEQNLIPLVMGYAARIGPSKDIPLSSFSNGLNGNFIMLFLALILCFYFGKYKFQ